MKIPLVGILEILKLLKHLDWQLDAGGRISCFLPFPRFGGGEDWRVPCSILDVIHKLLCGCWQASTMSCHVGEWFLEEDTRSLILAATDTHSRFLAKQPDVEQVRKEILGALGLMEVEACA